MNEMHDKKREKIPYQKEKISFRPKNKWGR